MILCYHKARHILFSRYLKPPLSSPSCYATFHVVFYGNLKYNILVVLNYAKKRLQVRRQYCVLTCAN